MTTEPLTDEELARIEQTWAVATLGPWESYDSYDETQRVYNSGSGDLVLKVGGGIRYGECDHYIDASKSDLAAICAAPEHVQMLLAEVKRLRERIAFSRQYMCTPVALETIICAAIRLPDGRVIRGHRHGDCIRTAVELVEHQHTMGIGQPWHASMSRDQGLPLMI